MTAFSAGLLRGSGSSSCDDFQVLARRKPLQPHVAYLICAYKPEYAFWEAGELRCPTWEDAQGFGPASVDSSDDERCRPSKPRNVVRAKCMLNDLSPEVACTARFFGHGPSSGGRALGA